MFDSDAIRKARRRDGDKATNRPDKVDEIFAPKEKVGFKNELPLLDRDYDDYPDKSELLRPSGKETLQTLVDHKKIHRIDDIVDELSLGIREKEDEKTIKQAADLHGIDLPDESSFDIEVEQDRLDALLGDVPDDMVTGANPIVVGLLYVGKGLSVEEMSEVLDFREAIIRQTLVDARLLYGETSEEQEKRRMQNRHEVNRQSNGLNFEV